MPKNAAAVLKETLTRRVALTATNWHIWKMICVLPSAVRMKILVQIVVQIIAEAAEYDEEDWANTCYVNRPRSPLLR